MILLKHVLFSDWFIKSCVLKINHSASIIEELNGYRYCGNSKECHSVQNDMNEINRIVSCPSHTQIYSTYYS